MSRQIWSRGELKRIKKELSKKLHYRDLLSKQLLDLDCRRFVLQAGRYTDWDDRVGNLFDEVISLRQRIRTQDQSIDIIEADLKWAEERQKAFTEEVDHLLLPAFFGVGIFDALYEHEQDCRCEPCSSLDPDELGQERKEYETIRREFETHRHNFYFQFKQWATPFLGKKTLKELENDFGAIWLHRSQKISKDLADAEETYKGTTDPYSPKPEEVGYRETLKGTGDNAKYFREYYSREKRSRIEAWTETRLFEREEDFVLGPCPIWTPTRSVSPVPTPEGQ